jgi:hypothetical protein
MNGVYPRVDPKGMKGDYPHYFDNMVSSTILSNEF